MFDLETRPIVSVEDPALDRDKMDIEKYAKTRDPSLIVELPGQKARRYVVRRLKRGEVAVLSQLRAFYAVAGYLTFGLLRIEEPDGTITLPTKKIPNVNGRPGMQTVWDDDPGGELDVVYDRINASEFYEVAGVIETMAGMRAGEAFGSSDERFTLLPSSQAALGRIARLAAERTRTA
jgi:hypothetical protein